MEEGGITRSVIQPDGSIHIWRQINHSSFDSYCICSAVSNPPCAFCTSTCECDRCGHIFNYEEITLTDFGYECEECIELNKEQ